MRPEIWKRRNILLKCAFTVRLVIPARSAISLLSKPFRKSRAICFSRLVSWFHIAVPFELIGTDKFHDTFDSDGCSCREFRQGRLREAEGENVIAKLFLFAV
jgi:hypothetical protein